MLDGLVLLGGGLLHFLTPVSLFNIAWATLLGIVIGALPGLTATMGVALLVTLTYKMAPDQAILVLMGAYLLFSLSIALVTATFETTKPKPISARPVLSQARNVRSAAK